MNSLALAIGYYMTLTNEEKEEFKKMTNLSSAVKEREWNEMEQMRFDGLYKLDMDVYDIHSKMAFWDSNKSLEEVQARYNRYKLSEKE